ncbi:MAG: hypothetical protein ING19_03430 [Azospirillum sp.]|nr:hypothetical protein [Azospirillum sp.]MCA3265100.1 hypothetical protein [Azospirillum sp.]
MAPPAFLAPLGGVIDLLKGDRAGVAKLGAATTPGLVASFLIPGLLLVPAYSLLVSERFEALNLDPTIGEILVVEPIAYLIGWTLFPVLSHLYCERIGKTREWYDYVAAYNWSNILQMALYLPAALIAEGGMPVALMFVLSVGILAATVGIHFRLARMVLRVDALPAMVLVAIDLGGSVLLARLVERLYAN